VVGAVAARRGTGGGEEAETLEVSGLGRHDHPLGPGAQTRMTIPGGVVRSRTRLLRSALLDEAEPEDRAMDGAVIGVMADDRTGVGHVGELGMLEHVADVGDIG